jgi:hypothetical protein
MLVLVWNCQPLSAAEPGEAVALWEGTAPGAKGEGREHGWKPVTGETPPAFMWVTHRDDDRPAQTAEFYQMLHEAGVEAELHIFGGWGPHGTGLAPGEPGIGKWPDLLERWLRRNGFLTGMERVSVSGQVIVDGEPLHRGWVKLIPLDAPGAPIASDYITHREEGRFEIAAEFGPVPGRHRVD